MSNGREKEAVLLFSRKGCHLCEAVEAEMRSVSGIAANLTVVDIDKDSALHDMYFLRIPVIRVGDRTVFEAKMMDRDGQWKITLRALFSEP